VGATVRVDTEDKDLESGWIAAWCRLISTRSFWAGAHIWATMAAAFAAVYLALTIPTSPAQTTAISIFGLATLGSFAALMSRQMQAAMADRLDALCRALDTAADAQMIAGPSGRALYINPAFQHLFSG